MIHSKLPNCRCKHHYVHYGLLVVSYHGLRCETQTHSFTYLSMSLIAVSVLFLIIFVILMGMLARIIFSKRNLSEYPSFSIEYHNKLYRPRKKLSTKNKMSDTEWMQKFRTIRNSWKYINIKMNRSRRGRSSGKKKNAAAHFKKHCDESEMQSMSNKSSTNKTLKRFLSKKSSGELQNTAAQSTLSLIGHTSSKSDIYEADDNFLFANKSCETQIPTGSCGNTLPPTYSSAPPIQCLDTKVPSNLHVYPKPSRSSNENRFSLNRQEEKSGESLG